MRVLKGHNGPVFDVAFDPTGRLLATASGDRTVKLWDVASGERLDTFSQPTKDQYAVVFSPDGQHVIAGGGDSRIRVWRISPSAKEGTNELAASLFAHDGPIMRLAVSRDGRWLASSSEDRTIKIWDTARLVQVTKLADQSDWTTALAIAPDNRTLAAGRMDGTLSFQTFGDAMATVASVNPLDYAKPPRPVAGPDKKLHVQNEVRAERFAGPSNGCDAARAGERRSVAGHGEAQASMPTSITTDSSRKAGQFGSWRRRRPVKTRPPIRGSTFCTPTVRPSFAACCGPSATRPSRFVPSTRAKGEHGWKTGKKWMSTSFCICREK